MHPTHNDLPEKLRKQVTSELNQLLADALDLWLQTKQAHWNVRGSSFIALHKLFDEVYERVGEHVDEIAERITALGGTAEGTLQAVTAQTRLEPYPLSLEGEMAHVAKLSMALAAFGSYARESIDRFDRLGDAGSTDLCTQVSRSIDKDLWFVSAHLPDGATGDKDRRKKKKGGR